MSDLSDDHPRNATPAFPPAAAGDAWGPPPTQRLPDRDPTPAQRLTALADALGGSGGGRLLRAYLRLSRELLGGR